MPLAAVVVTVSGTSRGTKRATFSSVDLNGITSKPIPETRRRSTAASVVAGSPTGPGRTDGLAGSSFMVLTRISSGRAVVLTDGGDERRRRDGRPDVHLPVLLDRRLAPSSGARPTGRRPRCPARRRRRRACQRDERVLVGEVAQVERDADRLRRPAAPCPPGAARTGTWASRGTWPGFRARSSERIAAARSSASHTSVTLRPGRFVGQRLERRPAVEVVVEPDRPAVADVVGRHVVVADVGGVEAAAE